MKIQELKIYTKNLSDQVNFYSKTIGLKICKQTDLEVSFLIGKSKLKLIRNKNFKPYHYAINIPSNKDTEALYWLKSKVEILKEGKNEIQDFDFWNAKAIYFYDMDRNIVELIARKNLNNQCNKKFSSDSFLEISEIGMPVNNIKENFKQLNHLSDINVFDGGFERFCAIGDEYGLFICINKNVKDWFPTNDKAYSSEFEIKYLENNIEYKLEFKNEKIKALANKT